MAIFTARGSEAKESIEKKKVDLKNAYYRMKSGDSAKVRILSDADYVEYVSHGSFTHKVYTQPCVSVIGKECPLCTASKSGIEGFDALYPKKRYVFVFGDMASGELKALDVSKNQAKALISAIEEYKEELSELAFTLKKTGESTSTTYTLSPIIRMKGDDQLQFDGLADQEVTDEYLEGILEPRTIEFQVGVLKEAGFPTDEYFPHIQVKEAEEKTQDEAEEIYKNM